MSNVMDAYQWHAEDIPFKISGKTGGKVSKMTKTISTEAIKPVKTYRKSRGEHFKDILIAVLVTSVIAFVGGMHFANKHNAEVQSAVKAAQVSAPVAEAKK